MTEEIEWFVGIDWASQSHQVCLVDAQGECLGERAVAHGGAGIEELCDWLIARIGAAPEVIGVANRNAHHSAFANLRCGAARERPAFP